MQKLSNNDPRVPSTSAIRIPIGHLIRWPPNGRCLPSGISLYDGPAENDALMNVTRDGVANRGGRTFITHQPCQTWKFT
ncbi:hypothetical protein CEXT_118451 [Caerostris extrusa]|uniref:Uncharacterized protein n=1 Tax=Caerostris extrusa TaxID=172846 RepID=A0AAV4UG52_CAEEX|nr:hypothetical protein CEXT_118451 [Caerostris extrusa]